MTRDDLLHACRTAYPALDWRPVADADVCYDDMIAAALPDGATLLVSAQRAGLSVIALSARVCDRTDRGGDTPYWRLREIGVTANTSFGPVRSTVAAAVSAWADDLADQIEETRRRADRAETLLGVAHAALRFPHADCAAEPAAKE